ncbi:MAG: GNAT family N-acetyltransferase [Cytophagales bacterium]|nr:GNAT family N-acetyltransferase [Cytophagales bacterium]
MRQVFKRPVVRQLTQNDDVVLEFFLNELSTNDPTVMGYHYPFYRNVLHACQIGEPFYLGLFLDSMLSAVLPGFIKTTNLGTAYCSMPFFGPNAGVLCKNEIKELAHGELLKFLAAELTRKYSLLSASFYTPFLFKDYNLYEENLPGSIFVQKTTQFFTISNKVWTTKIKYDLRRSERLGIVVTEEITDSNVQELYTIYLQNCLDQNIPQKPLNCILALSNAAKNHQGVEFYFAFQGENMIGGLIVLYSKKTLSYYLPCSLETARSLQPVTCLIDFAFQKARSKKIDYWNWESSPSKESGVYKFKNKWGSIETDYRIYVKPFVDIEYLSTIGKTKLAESFPHFFVFPFESL